MPSTKALGEPNFSKADKRPSDTRNLTLRLSPDAAEAVDWISEQRGGASASEVIRRAIGTEKLLLEFIKEGSTVLIEQRNGRVKELILR